MDEVSKINLGLDDIKYLKSLLFHAARDKIARDLPVAESDPIRTRVEQIVNEFIHEGFEMASDSMNIVGMDASKTTSLKELLEEPSAQDIEPFDRDLNDKLRELYGEVDKKTLEISELRRKLPEETKDSYEKGLNQRNNELQRLIDKENMTNTANILGEQLDFKIMNQVKSEFNEILKELQNLSETGPSEFEELNKLETIIKQVREFY